MPLLWKFPDKQPSKKWPPATLVKAGSRLFGHNGLTVTSLELPRGANGPQIVWEHRMEGTPGAMLAADGRLFVVTREGRLTCFGLARVQPREYPLAPALLAGAEDGCSAEADEILKQTGVGEGYCLVLGVGTGRLANELLRKSRLKIIAVDRDRAKVDRLREDLVAAGLYGVRAEAFTGDPARFPFPPYLASLVVWEDREQSGLPSVPASRFWDVLRPYGGTLCLSLGAEQQGLLQWAAEARRDGAEVRQAGRFFLLRGPGPLPAQRRGPMNRAMPPGHSFLATRLLGRR